MTTDAIERAQEVKRAEALLRETRAVLRRLDRLVSDAGDDAIRTDLTVLRDACEQTVVSLAQRERALQRHARDAVRRLR
jgi:hypothetical protein